MSQIKNFYDATAGRYDLRQANPWTRHLRKAEEKLLRKFAHGRVLDIGCGTGHHLAFLEKNNISTELFGVDVSKEMLKEARKKCSTHVMLVESPAENLSFPDNNFDTIVCFHGTFNFVNSAKTIHEMSRILRRGGIVILSVTSIWDKDYPSFWKKIVPKNENIIKTTRLEKYKIMLNLFSKNMLFKIFGENSFQVLGFRGLFIYQRPYWGRFHISWWQKIALGLDNIFPLNKFGQAGCVYLAVFKKLNNFS